MPDCILVEVEMPQMDEPCESSALETGQQIVIQQQRFDVFAPLERASRDIPYPVETKVTETAENVPVTFTLATLFTHAFMIMYSRFAKNEHLF